LVAKGSNSEIYLYGGKGSKVVLKVVPTACSKEAGHLSNEYRLLSKLEHENIIRALKFKEKIILNGTGSKT
jgi:predicted Ser/Thr protein kinase